MKAKPNPKWTVVSLMTAVSNYDSRADVLRLYLDGMVLNGQLIVVVATLGWPGCRRLRADSWQRNCGRG